MLKSVAILTLAVLVFCVQTHSQPHKTKKAADSDKPALPVAPVIPEQKNSTTLQPEANQHINADVRVVSTPAKDRYDKISFWLNIALVGVGIGGIIIAVKTLGKIERQTKATEINARSLINAERAWIVVTVESPSTNLFHFRATNVGKTPAKITSIWGDSVVVGRGDKLELRPDSETAESLLNTPPRLLPPTASCIVLQCKIEELGGRMNSSEQWIKHLIHGFSTIWSYGRIIYFDTLEGEVQTPHETRYLYWHLPLAGALPIPDHSRSEWNDYK